MNKFGTVYLHDPEKFGAGISNNVSFNNFNAQTVTGCIYRMEEDGSYVYQNYLSNLPSVLMKTEQRKIGLKLFLNIILVWSAWKSRWFFRMRQRII